MNSGFPSVYADSNLLKRIRIRIYTIGILFGILAEETSYNFYIFWRS